MANLSDLLQLEHDTAQVPPWIEALDHNEGFVEGFAPGRQNAEAVPNRAEELRSVIDDAYARGEAAGRAAAAAEQDSELAMGERVTLALQTLDQTAQRALAEHLRSTVLRLCEPVLVESAIDADALIKRCEDAAQRFGSLSQTFQLNLHPDDLAIVQGRLDGQLQVKPDASLERGSVRLLSDDGSYSDGPAQWREAIAAVLGQ